MRDLIRNSRSRPNLLRRSCKYVLLGALGSVAGLLRPALPLSTRKRLVTWVERRRLPGRYHFSMAMLKDFSRREPNMFHRFLWSNHFGYAANYEISKRFGASKIASSRHILFADITSCLRSRGVDPDSDVRAVFEVGCSLGYLLRYAETDVFPAATILHGLDIDKRAVDTGSDYLCSLDSKVQLTTADMTDAGRIMGGQIYDVILCCGVLMYLDENTAGEVVRTMLAHAGRLVGILCLAHPEIDNTCLSHSEIRPSDGAFIHNVDQMIRRAGGSVLSCKWVKDSVFGAHPAYAILAEPSRAERTSTLTPGP